MCVFVWQVKHGKKSSLKKKMKYVDIQEQVEGQESWIFTNTKCWVDKNTNFQWNTLFQPLQLEEFQILLQDDPNAKLSKGIFRNIYKSGLYKATTKPPILPCLHIIEWLTQKVDDERRTLLDFDGKHLESYQDLVLNQMYDCKEAQIKVT